ncbi:MAG: hypothetical protein ACFFDN_14430 [Candidatus Hodarchaeota archaeon]
MITTIIGLILLLVPFLLINKFKNKKLGFFYVLSFVIGFHLVIAILTQLFHIFSYGIILGINLLVCFIILLRLNFKELVKDIKRIKIDLILVLVIIILFIQLYSVHYNYTGKVTTVVEPYKEVKHMKYPYPYFSDEWYTVSFVRYSIKSGSLPLVNPLWYDSPFVNLELPFHSFVSEIILLLDLNPLTQYTILNIFSGLLICLLVYFILRVNKIDKFSSTIACLSVPYIINGANLPGIWTFIPLVMGIISMLLGFLFMSVDEKKMIFFAAFLTLVFYPPLFVLYGVSAILYFIFANISRKEKIKSMLLYSVLCALIAITVFVIVLLVTPSWISAFDYVYLQLFYKTFTKNAIPDFSIFKVVPVFILMFSAFGIFKAFRRRSWLVVPIFIGLVYWVFYSFVLWRVIIEYERVVVSTSILIVILSGFGLCYLITYLRRINFVRRYKILKISQFLILILFLIFSFFYTQRDNWQGLKLYSLDREKVNNPASPANNYLQFDDLKLFEGINGKSFLSIPWKGTVIGVATGNYPLETKPGTISNTIIRFRDFMGTDCEGKIKIAKDYRIDYVYSPEFKCSGFELIGTSSEGLYLYKVLKN